MELTGRVRILEDSGFGVWRVEAKPNELKLLGNPLFRARGRSILTLGTYDFSEDWKFLVFPLNEVKILALGDNEDCLVISTEEREKEPIIEQWPTPTVVRSTNSSFVEQEFRSGDREFINACRSELLPERVVRLAEDFLKQVREFSDDTLREGKHRKWVTYPKNFLALTIQNQKKRYCIHVKKSNVLSSLSDQLDIRDDRPGYVRFWLQDQSELEAAVRAAKGSFAL